MRATITSAARLLAVASLLTAAATAQSLGEYARRQRALKPATPAGAKVYTNDNLPTSGALSQVSEPAPSAEPLSPRAAAAAERAERKKAEDQKSLEADWRAKFAEQKKNIARLQREAEVLIGENKVRRAEYEHNTSAQLQRSREFAEAEQRSQAEIAEKQQALDAAKQKLESMKAELRDAGLPSSWAD